MLAGHDRNARILLQRSADGVREKLRERRLTSALFDSPQFTRRLEEAYEAMRSSQHFTP